MIVAWLLFPLLLGVLCLGAGLLIERLAGFELPGVLLIPIGFMTLVVAASLTTYWSTTAPLTTEVVIVLAAAGLLASRVRLVQLRPDLWAVLATGAVFAVFAAPVVLSGQATFAGYGVLGDTSVHLTLIDRFLEHGRTVPDGLDSTYSEVIRNYLATAYPVGAQMALGSLGPLTGQNIAWIYQPYLAGIMAITSLSFFSIARGFTDRRPVCALVAFVASQPALVYFFSLQGTVKELATVCALTTLVALIAVFLEHLRSLRSTLVVAVPTAAALEILGPAVLPWLVPLLLGTLVLVIARERERGIGPIVALAASFAGAVVVLALPVVLDAVKFVTNTEEVVTSQTEIGNLAGPLRKSRAFGVWFPDDLTITYLFAGLVGCAAIAGAIWAIARRLWLPLLFVVSSVIGSAAVIQVGSPWVDAKALMIASPAILLTAMIAVAALVMRGKKPLGVALGALLTAGVLLSNAIAYNEVSLAPRDRLAELSEIQDRLDGEGPLLYNEFEEFAKHFLYEQDPTGWSEVFGPKGRSGRFGFPARLDEIAIDKLQRYPTIVVRRSPSADRPPAGYVRAHTGEYYEVWQRRSGSPKVEVVLALGAGLQPSGKPDVASLAALAAEARRRNQRLAYAPRSGTYVIALDGCDATRGTSDVSDLSPLELGVDPVECSFTVGADGEYAVWLAGSFSRPVTVSIDANRIAKLGRQRNGSGQFARFGTRRLTRGAHTIRLDRHSNRLVPSNGAADTVSAAVLTPPPQSKDAVRYLSPRQWQRLLGRELDWVAAVHR